MVVVWGEGRRQEEKRRVHLVEGKGGKGRAIKIEESPARPEALPLPFPDISNDRRSRPLHQARTAWLNEKSGELAMFRRRLGEERKGKEGGSCGSKLLG